MDGCGIHHQYVRFLMDNRCQLIRISLSHGRRLRHSLRDCCWDLVKIEDEEQCKGINLARWVSSSPLSYRALIGRSRYIHA